MTRALLSLFLVSIVSFSALFAVTMGKAERLEAYNSRADSLSDKRLYTFVGQEIEKKHLFYADSIGCQKSVCEAYKRNPRLKPNLFTPTERCSAFSYSERVCIDPLMHDNADCEERNIKKLYSEESVDCYSCERILDASYLSNTNEFKNQIGIMMGNCNQTARKGLMRMLQSTVDLKFGCCMNPEDKEDISCFDVEKVLYCSDLLSRRANVNSELLKNAAQNKLIDALEHNSEKVKNIEKHVAFMNKRSFVPTYEFHDDQDSCIRFPTDGMSCCVPYSPDHKFSSATFITPTGCTNQTDATRMRKIYNNYKAKKEVGSILWAAYAIATFTDPNYIKAKCAIRTMTPLTMHCDRPLALEGFECKGKENRCRTFG
jgi:hypothetical protein